MTSKYEKSDGIVNVGKSILRIGGFMRITVASAASAPAAAINSPHHLQRNLVQSRCGLARLRLGTVLIRERATLSRPVGVKTVVAPPPLTRQLSNESLQQRLAGFDQVGARHFESTCVNAPI